MSHQIPRLFQLLSDARIGQTFGAAKPAIVLGENGRLLIANRALLTLLRVNTRTEAAAAIGAERGPLAAVLRQVNAGTAGAPPQKHILPLQCGGIRRAVEFAVSRIQVPGGGSVVLLVATEPAGAAPDATSAASAVFQEEDGAFALLDRDGRRLYANDAAAALMGAAGSLDELVPGARRAVARARADGFAVAEFGVLRIPLQRIGNDDYLLLAAAFTSPKREGSAASEISALATDNERRSPEPSMTAASITASEEIREHARSTIEEVVREESEPSLAAHGESVQAFVQVEPSAGPPMTSEIEEKEKEPAAETRAAAPAQETKSGPKARAAEPETEPQDTPAAAPETQPQAAQLPRRFVWQTDADDRFESVSPELAAVVGEALAAVIGLNWSEAGTSLGIEGTAAVAAAVAKRDTWSGVTVTWPVEDRKLVRPVELAALPVFDRERRFLGYRGFGVFRDPMPKPAAASRSEPKTAAEPASVKPARPVEPAMPVRSTFGKRTHKVVPLHKTSAAEPPRPTLTPVERNAFREIAKALGTRMQRVNAPERSVPEKPPVTSTLLPPAPEPVAPSRAAASSERAILDRLPIGVVVHRSERLLYINRTLLDWIGATGMEEFATSGGLERLFVNGQGPAPEDPGDRGHPVALRGRDDEAIPVEARLLSATWDGDTALVYAFSRTSGRAGDRLEASELALRDAEASVREMRAILDTATDGVALLDREGHVLGMNRSAEALFGFDSAEIEGKHFTTLFAPESHRAALDYLDGLATNGVASVLNDGREVIGRVREGGLIPLFMTLGRVGEGGEKFCAVFRDITQWKRAEEELVQARRHAERASSAKSDFLAKISHEIRTPLNAIIGFAEVMMEERLGPIANERYREYLKDIHTSGEHLISLINDLLDLSKIEAGKLDLVFSSVDLNEIASQSMALMQPQANRERIIIRTALSPNLPPVVADSRSIRQIVLNLLSNSIRFTPPGGQVIVSTSLTDDGEVHLRVRDTGIGMSETEIKTALEPFRQIATTGRTKSGGTGLGLPLTKALAEANRASFSIKSTKNAGTLVEIAFPSTRVLAE